MSVSTADEAVELGRIFGQMASYMTKLLVMACSHGNRLSDRNVLMGALHVVLDVAEKRNCCSLTAFAMRSAHQLGFKMSDIQLKEGAVYTSPLPLSVPDVVMDLFSSPCLVFARMFDGTSYRNAPNAHLTEHLGFLSADKVVPHAMKSAAGPPQLLNLLLEK